MTQLQQQHRQQEKQSCQQQRAAPAWNTLVGKTVFAQVRHLQLGL